jgi:hypothetical protein
LRYELSIVACMQPASRSPVTAKAIPLPSMAAPYCTLLDAPNPDGPARLVVNSN